MSASSRDPMGRLALLVGAGFVAVAVVTAIPGRAPPPLPPAPEPPREVTAGMTPPRVLSEAELLALIGNTRAAALEGTAQFSLTVSEEGRVRGVAPRRWSGDPRVAEEMRGIFHHLRLAPALDEEGRPVRVRWDFDVSVPQPVTLAPLNWFVRPGLGGPDAPEGGYSVEDLENELPVFTPLTDLPVLLNPHEVDAEIRQRCPRLSGEAGGDPVRTRVYFLVDREGRVRRTRPHLRSPIRGANDAALEVARVHRFTPALDAGQPVVAWVSLPVTFGEDGCATAPRSGVRTDSRGG